MPGIYTEVDDSRTYSGGYTDYVDERLVFDDTSCAKCTKPIGPMLDEDPDTGRPIERWVGVWSGPLGLVCEDCAEEEDPTPPVHRVRIVEDAMGVSSTTVSIINADTGGLVGSVHYLNDKFPDDYARTWAAERVAANDWTVVE